MTTAYSRIDRFLRQNLNDKNYPAYKDELDAICQAKLQRTWVGLIDKDMNEPKTHIFDFIAGARWAESILKERNT